MAEPAKKQFSNKTVVIIAFLLLIVAFILFQQATGFRLNLLFSDSSNDGMAEGSLQLAVQSCRHHIQIELGNSVQQMETDERATRYNAANQEYQVIVDLMMRGAARDDYWAQCWVSAVNQEVIDFRFNAPSGQFEAIEF